MLDVYFKFELNWTIKSKDIKIQVDLSLGYWNFRINESFYYFE